MSRSPRFLMGLAGIVALVGGLACSSTPKTSSQSIQTLIASSLHYRRPVVASAEDKAGPGGIDYQTTPLPSKNFDCQPLPKLMPDVDWNAVQACLTTGTTLVTTLYYQLKREQQPYLELFVDEKAPPPECVQKTLLKIPVPREIFYVSTDTGQPACYSSRIDVNADKFFDTKMPSGEYAMEVFLPLRNPPKDADEAKRIVMSWTITPLWNHEFRQFDGVVFPDALCKRCMGEKILQPSEHNQILSSWPPR